MSTKYHGEKVAREASRALLELIKNGSRYTSREIVAILEKDYSPQLLRNLLFRYRQQSLLDGHAATGYTLTDKGLERLQRLQFHLLQQTTVWDQKWRIVIYDIPEQHRSARNRVRRLIKQLGFKQKQQSVWVHPLPCLGEFETLRVAYGAEQHILLLEVDHTNIFDEDLKHFLKTYPQLY